MNNRPPSNNRRRNSRPPQRSGGGRGYGSGPRSRVANSQPLDNTPVPAGLVFYCKSCEQIVDYHPATFNFKYPIENCQKEKANTSEEKKAGMLCDIAYGTEKSIKRYYKIKDEKFDAERRAREEKAARADKL